MLLECMVGVVTCCVSLVYHHRVFLMIVAMFIVPYMFTVVIFTMDSLNINDDDMLSSEVKSIHLCYFV